MASEYGISPLEVLKMTPRQVVALYEVASKRKYEEIKIKAKLSGVELKDPVEIENNNLTPDQENKLLNARMETLKRIREEKIGKSNI